MMRNTLPPLASNEFVGHQFRVTKSFPVLDNVVDTIGPSIVAADEALVIMLLRQRHRGLGVIAIVQDLQPDFAIAKAPSFVADIFDLQGIWVVLNAVLRSRGPITASHSGNYACTGKRKQQE